VNDMEGGRNHVVFDRSCLGRARPRTLNSGKKHLCKPGIFSGESQVSGDVVEFRNR